MRSRLRVVAVLSLLAACSRGKQQEPQRTQVADEEPAQVYIPAPDVGVVMELSSPLAILEHASAAPVPEHALARVAEPELVPTARVARGPSVLLALPPRLGQGGRLVELAADGEDVVILEPTGLVRSIGVRDQTIVVLEHPLSDEGPAIRLTALEGEPLARRELASGEMLGHDIVLVGDVAFVIARVEGQGEVGGLARVSLAGGKPVRVGGEHGPAANLVSDGERAYWTAHVRNGPDEILSIGPDEEVAKLHYSYMRGIVSLAVDEEALYWVEAVFEPLSSTVAKLSKSDPQGEASGLWRLDGLLLDHLRPASGWLYFGTASVEDTGLVYAIPVGGGKVREISTHPRLWGLLRGDSTIFAEVDIEDGQTSGRAIVRLRAVD